MCYYISAHTFPGARAYSNAYFGQSVGRVLHQNSFQCFGIESRLVSCTRGNNNGWRNRSLEVGVKCEPGKCLEL